MPPKEGKKKLTKKEKEALKKAELERLAEEQRLAEAAEAERLEKERQRLAEEARVAAELAAKVAAELAERRVVEDKENAPLLLELNERLADEQRKREYASEWERYIACHVLPDMQSESAVNTYVTEWGEAPPQPLHGCLAECERTAALLVQLGQAHALALRRPRAEPGSLWYPTALATLSRMTISKLDALTSEILANADERASSRNELQLSAQTDALKLGLWVNLARNPRVKAVDLPEIGVSIELPKALALASVAIRLVQLRTEHAAPSFGVPSSFQPLGGVAILDLLALPPMPKRVKGWTLRQVGPAAHGVTRMAYPLPQIGGESAPSAGAAAPLRLSVQLAADVLLSDKMVKVGWWDDEAKQWSLDGISEIRYDQPSRRLSFLTTHLCALAVLQPTHAQLPYTRWSLNPTARSKSVLAVQTAHHLVVLDVSADGVMLLDPRLPELHALLDVRMPSPVLLGLLRQAGVNLLPTDRDAAPLHAVTPKDAELEEEALRELLRLAPTFRLAHSKWNASRARDKVCVRVGVNLAKEDDDELIPSSDPKPVDHFAGLADEGWATLLYAHRYAALIQSGEADSAIALDVHGMEELARGEVAHGSAVSCLKERQPQLIVDLASASAHYMSVLHGLCAQLRLLSFTS